mmetsp:Transcript_3740/g.5594  ORF Transcript_3740/g.5594 Transcript_3740/m.5594 type:complete len:474 (-) Transcript_3740:416-1837(-)|eukprot:CAMPEP_0194116390 /NCGR_PEP_ID=MMETSP0150-20130528/26901_1 /TAXON_ID=122233 /ORGANISM="Chaetoceros debilis, Strain MM31A-1" /LENGTH=473 /DNA_ID=CAMNT_0038807091 /DNA_START=38 /DNA_END=1459 /DNA_ORIENTATION=-
MRISTPPSSDDEGNYDDIPGDLSTTRYSFPHPRAYPLSSSMAFDKPNHVAYFNNSGKTPLPLSVQKIGQAALNSESNPWTLPNDANVTEQVRCRFAALIGAANCGSSDNDNAGKSIAIVPSTGFALTLAAHNLMRTRTPKTNNLWRVLILQDEMSSEVYPWQEAASLGGLDDDRISRSVEFVVVPHPKGFSCDETANEVELGWTKQIIDTLESKHDIIDICCVPQVHWSDGSLVHLDKIGSFCSTHNISFVVDGTQSVGIYPSFNVQQIQCDVLAVSAHKWLLGPHSISLMYIHPKYHETWLPLDQHERSRVVFQDEIYDATKNNIKNGSGGYPDAFIPGAARCDGGGKKNPILQPMVNEGLRLVNELDLEAAHAYLQTITDEIYEGAKKLGFSTQAGPRAGHIIGLRPKCPTLVDFLTPEKMVEIAHSLANDKGVFFAVRNGAFRISPYLYTTSGNVKHLIDSLSEAVCNAL